MGRTINSETNATGGYCSQIGYIDSMRGFAILCVVIGHVGGTYYTSALHPEIKVV